MPRVPVGLRAEAAHDIERAIDHYLAEAGESVALSFIEAIEHFVVGIGRAPLVGTLRFSYELGIPDLRAWPLGHFPYVIFYVTAEDRVEVWRVLHTARDLPTEMPIGGS